MMQPNYKTVHRNFLVGKQTIEAVLPVPRFSRGIGLVLMRRCGKNLAVVGCCFLGYFFAITFSYFGLVFGVTTSVKVEDNCV